MEQIAKNAISDSEFMVLNCLGQRADDVKIEVASEEASSSVPTTEVAEISTNTGIRDNDEVLRALYTLEGKNLVSPEPAGDFTSNQWQITPTGLKALRLTPSNF
jgi:hypothetical protein